MITHSTSHRMSSKVLPTTASNGSNSNMTNTYNTHRSAESADLFLIKRKSFNGDTDKCAEPFHQYPIKKPSDYSKDTITKPQRQLPSERFKRSMRYTTCCSFFLAIIWGISSYAGVNFAMQPYLVIVWRNVSMAETVETKVTDIATQTSPETTIATPKEDGDDTKGDVVDNMFSRFLVSERSFDEVRLDWNQTEEIAKTQLERVQLPTDFSGDYSPKSLSEFIDLSQKLVDKAISPETPRTSKYGIVSLCIGIDICDLSRPNHEAYAKKHNYDYIHVGQIIPGVQPKMVKYLVLTWAMKRGYSWLLMMDADALFTNMDLTIEELIQEFDPEEQSSLIVSRGGLFRKLHVINNGVFLLRNTMWSLNHCYQIFSARWAFTRFLGKTLMDQPIQISLLLAANELAWPPVADEERGRHVVTIPKTRMNSFKREDYFEAQDIAEGCHWTKGDWIAHVASKNKYSLIFQLLEELGMETPPMASRFSFSSGAEMREDTKAGSCWYEKGVGGEGEDGKDVLNCVPKYHVVGVHKAGTKALMGYLEKHPGLLGPFVEDPVQWLTDTVTNDIASKCSRKRVKHANSDAPIVVGKGGKRSFYTCSFKDYARLYGSQIEDLTRRLLTLKKRSKMENSKVRRKLSSFLKDKPTLYDEYVIWDSTFSKVRGVPLPQVIQLMQPSAKLLVTVRDPIQVSYSAYQHFGIFDEPKGPEHFDSFIRNMTSDWVSNDCHPGDYNTCLSSTPHSAIRGSWIARGMYATYLTAWMQTFSCEQLFIFDVSEDVTEEVRRLYEYMGAEVSDDIVGNATRGVYEIKKESVNTTQEFGDKRYNNPLNKAVYQPMLDETRTYLEEFYAPYNSQLCEMISEHQCLDVLLFRKLCDLGSSSSSSSSLQTTSTTTT